MASPVEWDKRHDWFWEGNVQEKIVEYMKNVDKFDVLSESNTFEKTPGPDILAKHGDKLRQVSVKGYPSDKYTSDFPGGKKGQKKRTQPPTQARHWFSEALFELILAKSKNQDLETALGLPKFQTYINFVSKMKWLRERIELFCYFVGEDGQVELVPP